MSNNSMVGNVQYSILESEAFGRSNGEGWVEMDGRDITGSKLNQISGMKNIPDARGVFLRSVNGKRTSGGDPNNDRTVGSYQSDELKKHSHPVNPTHPFMDNDMATNGCEGGGDVKYGRQSVSILEVGGPETRPCNIALYLYIKIN